MEYFAFFCLQPSTQKISFYKEINFILHGFYRHYRSDLAISHRLYRPFLKMFPTVKNRDGRKFEYVKKNWREVSGQYVLRINRRRHNRFFCFQAVSISQVINYNEYYPVHVMQRVDRINDVQ